MKKFASLQAILGLVFVVSACGASDTGDGSGNGAGADAGATECVPTSDTELSCGDGVDNDCDGEIDCADFECIGEPVCNPSNPVDGCGEASHTGMTLAIPDGNGQAYETSINITGFDAGQILEEASGFTSVCVNMEHSWLRDLQIELVCPSGQVAVLQQFLGTTGSVLHMGEPEEDDELSPTPQPGVGADYCWTADAPNEPMLEWANNNPNPDFTTPQVLPPGDYQPNEGWDNFVGCELNGDWTIRVIDDWEIDNGYIFEWNVNFNPDIISDCGEWID